MANLVPKPTLYPDWAMLDRTDPTSGVANTAVPSSGLQNYGPAYRELLARQHFNWLHRILARWTRWLEGEAIDIRAELDLEFDARTAADSGLVTITNGLREDVDAVTADLATEVSDREGAITSLSGQITTYVGGIQTTLQGNINAEASTRAGADTAINNLIQAYDNDTTDTSGIMELEGFAANQNINFYAQFLRHRASNVSPGMNLTEVVLSLPQVVATSDEVGMRIASASIPANLRPASAQRVPIVAVDNGDIILASIYLTTTGDWAILRHDYTDWSATGNKGIGPQLIRYQKALES
jgi:hypothetical protein